MKPEGEKVDTVIYKRFEIFKNQIDKLSNKDVPNKSLIQFQNFKIFMQGSLVNIAIHNFVENYECIMQGKYKNKQDYKNLIAHNEMDKVINELEKLTRRYCFSNGEVLELELRGEVVISDLLDLFVPAILKVSDTSKSKNSDQKLVNLISENFAYVQCQSSKSLGKKENWKEQIPSLSQYQKIQLVVDYISGMTDSYAVNLHKKLKNLN